MIMINLLNAVCINVRATLGSLLSHLILVEVLSKVHVFLISPGRHSIPSLQGGWHNKEGRNGRRTICVLLIIDEFISNDGYGNW